MHGAKNLRLSASRSPSSQASRLDGSRAPWYTCVSAVRASPVCRGFLHTPFRACLWPLLLPMADAASRLFNTLFTTFSAVFLGFACVKLRLISPGEGDMKARQRAGGGKERA